jgi:Na+-driven multidrug efflux pump
MGIKGAALATLLGQAFGLVLRWRWLRARDFVSPLSSFFATSAQHVKAIVAIGLPNALMSGVWSMVYPVLTSLCPH